MIYLLLRLGLDFLDNGSIFEHAITCAGNIIFTAMQVHNIIVPVMCIYILNHKQYLFFLYSLFIFDNLYATSRQNSADSTISC